MIGGGIQPSTTVSPQAQAFVSAHVAQINQAFGINNTGYKVIAESTQIVAGTNHFLSLEGLTDLEYYTITVYVPLNGAPQISEVSKGHG